MSETLIQSIFSLGQINRETLSILQASRSSEADLESLQAIAILEALDNVPVSKLSCFKDPVWDFNEDNPNISRLLRGVRLRIDFSRYGSIPAAVLLELKCVTLLFSQAPGVLVVGEANRKKAAKVLKAQTIAPIVGAGLMFIDKLYAVLREELGDEYIDRTLQSLSFVPSSYYAEAAGVYEFSYNYLIGSFFKVLQSPSLKGTLFPESLPAVDMDHLPWFRLGREKQPESEKSPKVSKVLQNNIFEHSSSVASMVVVDFLDSLGKTVVDASMLEIRNDRQFFQSRDNDLTPLKLNVYMSMRLFRAGYSIEHIKKIWPDGASAIDHLFANDDEYAFRKACAALVGSDFDLDFKQYISYVGYCCMYLVAQYTGMRPSELVRLLADSCLKEDEESGCWLLESQLEKNQENLVGLFDDYWVAIPIIRDAIEASIILSKIKQNPYVFSRANTIQFGEAADPLSSAGVRDSSRSFFKGFLSSEEVESLGIHPYMLRHTLAYQLYRADLGLPFISHQLKHFGELVGRPQIGRAFSETTLAYGEIADMLSKGKGREGKYSIKHLAELECVKSMYDPNGNYAGANAAEHKAGLQKEFAGYMAAGYSEDQVFEAMTEQHIAIISVGQGFCYGSRQEEHDESLPCIGGLRCNPFRCKNSIVTVAHAPAWKKVYQQNKKSLADPRLQHSREHYQAAMDEARAVLCKLGIEVDE
ncbi:MULTISPECIES: site-specific integrase [Pseudomonas]|uniref:site-specific integrase n=1 Tax=Pseudomonas TaxID=286 RepID=UPI00217F3FE1|nr:MULTISPECIES: site-specific integrase [Pseudomonas]WIN06913.1 site-specific integrase [Pseudomonas syringae pv. antirrhini str. 126]